MGDQSRSFEFRRDCDRIVGASGSKSKLFDPLGTRIANVASRVDTPADTTVTWHILIRRATDVVILHGHFSLNYKEASVFQVLFHACPPLFYILALILEICFKSIQNAYIFFS